MTTQELIQYLGACYDVEQGLHESRRMTGLLKDKRAMIDRQTYDSPLPRVSEPPTEEKPLKDFRAYYARKLERDKAELLEARLSLNLKDARKYKAEIQEDQRALAEEEAKEPYRQQENQARATRYAVATADWERKNAAYQDGLRLMAETAIASINTEIKHYEAEEAHFAEALGKLYDMNILHAEFRHAEAVFQLRQYLEMGVAEQLSGPDGACRFYLEELRVQRVIGSIDKLRESVERGFQSVLEGQRALYMELSRVEANINEFRAEMDICFSEMNRRIAETGESVIRSVDRLSDGRDAYMRAIREEQQAMARVIERSAYNQYLIERRQHVDDYLGYVLQNPLV